MKLLDEKKRLFGVINPVDLVAILFVIAVVAVLANVLFGASVGSPTPAEGEDTIEMVLEGSLSDIEEIQYELGQEVSKVGGLGVMGTLESLELTDRVIEVYDAEGKPVTTTSVLSKKITLVVRGKGHITGSAASMGTEKVRQNMVFDAQLPHFQVSVRVMSIKKVAE